MPIRYQKIATMATVAALLVSPLVYWQYRDHQKRAEHDTVSAWVANAGTHVRIALSVEPAAALEDGNDTLKSLDARTRAVAKYLDTLRALDGGLQPPLVDAAESYLLAAREILRLHAASRRHRDATAIGLRELWQHMGSRYAQGPGWTTEAVRRKDLLEKEYAQYRNTTDALVRLLEGYREDRARLVPLLDVRQLPDESVTGPARERSLEAAKQMAAEMDRLRKLPRS